MEIVTLAADGLRARVSPEGGRVLSLDWQRGGTSVPLLHRCDETGPGGRSAFPLVPFGNRLAGSAFRFRGETIGLSPNTDDPHRLHGDGWLGRWQVETVAASTLTLAFRHQGARYRYEARQEIGLEAGAFRLTLSVSNTADRPLPFGLGWHPFLPRTAGTRLELRATGFRAETAGHLPGDRAPLPTDLDFSTPAGLPERWVNNGLEDWDGRARVYWPERSAGLRIDAGPPIAHALLFLPDRSFAPRTDWFCLEPMSHRAGAHHHDDLGDLRVLEPAQTLSATLRLSPFPFPQGSPDRP